MWDAKRGAEDWAYREYLVPAGAQSIQATLGLANNTESTDLRLQILVTDPVSGKVLHKDTASYGRPIQVYASIKDTIRISFRARILNSQNLDQYAQFVLGNVVLT